MITIKLRVMSYLHRMRRYWLILTYLNFHNFVFVNSIKRQTKLISTSYNISIVTDELYIYSALYILVRCYIKHMTLTLIKSPIRTLWYLIDGTLGISSVQCRLECNYTANFVNTWKLCSFFCILILDFCVVGKNLISSSKYDIASKSYIGDETSTRWLSRES